MRILTSAVTLVLLAAAVSADETSIYGTQWVKFEPLQAAGSLKGCSLVFMSVAADRAYLSGEAVAVNGNVQILDRDGTAGGLIMSLKVGLKELASKKPFQRPAFAYLQTGTGTTARATQAPIDGEPGY